MGNLRKIQGEILISPPLNWEEIKKTKANRAFDWQVKLVIDEKEVHRDEGILLVKTCSMIIPYTEEPYKGYEVSMALQDIVITNIGHSFSGEFDCWSEDLGEPPTRIWVDNAVVYEEKATIQWPNE